MKRNSGFDWVGLIALCATLTFAAFLFLMFIVGVNDAVSHQEFRRERMSKQVSAIWDLFNGQEKPLESWAFESLPIDEIAEEWCLSHSIPPDCRKAKVEELVKAFHDAVNGITIKLPPGIGNCDAPPAENPVVP